jgi:hypothetical protein
MTYLTWLKFEKFKSKSVIREEDKFYILELLSLNRSVIKIKW